MSELRLSAGLRVGPYELLAPLDAGDMAGIYRAWDHRLDRFVAIQAKRPASLGDAGRRAIFLREARVVGALRHPNIAIIHDLVCGDAVDFVVMEALSGKTLEATISVAGMHPDIVARVAVQIAGALSAAHAHGIVHGGLWPGGILVAEDWQVKVLDFGSGILSVPEGPWLAPEQVAGGPADARSDVFSLGAILFEMLTGRHAGPEEQLGANLPPEMAEIVQRCLCREPKERFSTAEFRAALRL